MRAACRTKVGLLFSALASAVVLISCGGDSTGPSGGNGSIDVTPANDTVAIGSSSSLSATVLDKAGHPVSGASVFWNTQDASIATVSGTGVVVGVALGTTRIAASSSGVSGFANVTVVPIGVASVRVTPPSAAIKIGETVHLQAQPLDASGSPLSGRTVTWSSSNTDVATVDNTGLVKGVGSGATTITATSEGKNGTSGIAVGAAIPASITVAPTSVSITTGQTSQLTATVKDSSGSVISGASVTWSSDNGAVAIVSSSGLVTGQGAGTATVTATSGTVHTNVPVTVSLPPANSVIVSPASVSLLVTEQQQLTATVTDAAGHTLPNQTVTWSSSNTGVATVNSSGVVSALLPGTATITGTSGAASGTAHVTVSLVPARKVTVDPDVLSFTQGDPGQQLTATVLDSAGNTLTGRTVSFSSNKPNVATVNGTGFVTPAGPGQAVITISVPGTGLSTTVSVTVTQVPVASVSVTPSLDTLVQGQSVQLNAQPQDGSGNPLSGRAISWNSSDDGVAIVSSSGKVVSQGTGTATITATSEGKTGTSTIVVVGVPVASVAISPATQSVVVGGTTPAFTAVTKDSHGNTLTGRTVTWSSSNTDVATIDPNTGVATGVAEGTTNITATSEGVTSNTATLTVTPVPVGSVTVDPPSQSVVSGSSVQYTATTKDGQGNTLNGRNVAWSTSDPKIATVDNAGNATGTGPGTATITAASEGKSGTATLDVSDAPVTSVTVQPPAAMARVGRTVQLKASVMQGDKKTDGKNLSIAWTTSDSAKATVDNKGLVTAVDTGTATITASTQGKSGSAVVTITP